MNAGIQPAGEAPNLSAKNKHRTATVMELAGHALQLAAAPNHLAALLIQQRMDPAFREEISVAVATLNACKYCNYAHHDFALNAGVSTLDLAQLEGIAPEDFDEKKFLAIAYARELVGKGFGRISPELEDKVKARYSPEERGDIQTAARIMMLSSLLCNTADAFVDRLNGEPVDDSRLLDEAVIAGTFFGLILPVVGLYLSVQRRESPIRTLRDFRQFAGSYQQQTGGEQP